MYNRNQRVEGSGDATKSVRCFGLHISTCLNIVSITLIILVGLIVRLDSWLDWQERTYRAFHKSEPLLTNVDGYYYLSLARDLVEGNNSELNEKRITPDHPKRSSPPPLLSVIVASLVKILPFSMNWIAVFLPVFLGMLVAIPVYQIGRYYGGPLAGYVSALATVISPYYVNRSSLGWFDTDSLLVFCVMSSIYFFMKFGLIKTGCRNCYLLYGILVWLLTLWLWDQAPHIATMMTLFPLIVAVFFYYRPKFREFLFFSGIMFSGFCLVLFWQGAEFITNAGDVLIVMLNYVTKVQDNVFPAVGISVGEQMQHSFVNYMVSTTGHPAVFVVAIVGLAMFIASTGKQILFFAVPIVLSVAAYFFANRFLVFVAPVFGISIGFLCAQILSAGGKRLLFRFLAPSMALVLLFPAYMQSVSTLRLPQINPVYVKGMERVALLTPGDSVIWSWWNNGYPLVYWGRRATVTDGSFHQSEVSVYNGLPLTTSSPRLSANFIRFFVRRGLSGIHQYYAAMGGSEDQAYKYLLGILKAGPEEAVAIIRETGLESRTDDMGMEEWLEFFYPESSLPVYLYMDLRLAMTGWWHWYGSWDVGRQTGLHPYYKVNFHTDPDTTKSCNGRVTQTTGGKAGTESIASADIANSAMQYFCDENIFVEADGAGADTVFWKLYFGGETPTGYFELVEKDFPAYQIWKVIGDSLPGGKGQVQ